MIIKRFRKFLLFTTMIIGALMFLAMPNAVAQIQIGSDIQEFDYARPKEYEIAGITVSGVKYLDQNILIMLSGLTVGETIKIPGEKTTDAIRKLWEQGLFEDVTISATNIIGNKIFLDIEMKERPRVSRFSFEGLKKTEVDDIRSKINLSRGDVATEHLFVKTRNIIKDYFDEKGYLNATVEIEAIDDESKENYVDLKFKVQKNSKIKIAKINIIGNEDLTDDQVRSAMKDTKQRGYFKPLSALGPALVNTTWDIIRLRPKSALETMETYFFDNYRLRILKSSKYIESNFETDRANIIKKYNQKGYRDASIVSDSVYFVNNKSIAIDIHVNEGNRYYFRNVTWVGNTKYDAQTLDLILGIQSGDVYNKELLETNLNFNQNGMDVSSLYMDDGYLFFQADPVEVLVENDSIDLEIRLREGPQARISNVAVIGNTRTNDNVIIRELYTRPGMLFSRSDVIRSTRELSNLRYFNNETIYPDIKPNYSDGTVDIEYHVEEASADQIEVSGGWGYGRLIGTLGLSFNNFSARRFFKKDAWKPIPFGDGQKLSLRLQTYGKGYLSYGISFTEPWLTGRKPTSLTVSYSHTLYTNGYSKSNENYASFKTDGFSVGIGKRLTWPDSYFTLYQSVNTMRYRLHNYSSIFNFGDGTGDFYVLSYNIVFGRSSTSQPIYPRSGSEFSLSLEVTPPYSLFSNKDYSTMNENRKYKWVEYHKWKFNTGWYTEIVNKFVLATKVRFGYLGEYNSEIGVTPFQRFYLGGDGLSSGYNLDGREVIGMRGYQNETVTPYYYSDTDIGGNIFSKYTLELRYPLSLAPTATIYAMAFVEAGNSWLGFDTFNPFDVKRSAGFGVRVYLPMFGLIGLDWGYGFDDIPGIPSANGSQFHFSIGGSID